jgi:large subunit ribosomal protein L7/L12
MGNVAELVTKANGLNDADKTALFGTLLERSNILQLAGILSSIEGAFGVKAAAPASAAPSGPAKPAAAAAPTVFDVILKNGGAKKIDVIKVVRAAQPTLGLKEAKDLVDKGNTPVKQGMEKAEAEKLLADIKAAGGDAELKGV